MFRQPALYAQGDKEHDEQMLDNRTFLFSGERIVRPREKHICRLTARRLGSMLQHGCFEGVPVGNG